MTEKRVLIIYATAGTGHKKAAQAIKRAFDELGGGIKVDIIDSLDYTNFFFRWTYPRIYIFLVNRIPFIWGLGYYLLDNRLFYSLVSWVRHLVNGINSRRLALHLIKEDYDVIISTHFLAPDVISMQGKEKIRGYLINVVTDFRMHSFWIAGGVDMYVVGHEETKNDLASKYRIPQDKIKMLGIPVDPVFSKNKDKAALKDALGIEKGLFTALVGSGGFGVGPIIELVKAFKGISIPVQILVICGKNETLRKDLESLGKAMNLAVIPYGYVDNMDEFMEVSDVIITKTGGMISSESLSKGLPMIGIAPIPGQETRNFELLAKKGVMLPAKKIEDVPLLVTRLYEHNELLMSLRRRIEAAKRPRSAYDIARFALAKLHETKGKL